MYGEGQPLQVMKAYGGVAVQFHTFFSGCPYPSGLNGRGLNLTRQFQLVKLRMTGDMHPLPLHAFAAYKQDILLYI